MKNALILLCAVVMFAQCKKADDNPIDPPDPIDEIGTVIDTALNPNTFPDCAIDLDNDALFLSDVNFHIWKSFSTAGANVKAFYPGAFFYEDKWASIETNDFSMPPVVTWDSVMYQQVQVFNLGDTIGYSTKLTPEPYFTDYISSFTPGVEKKWTRLDNLIGIGRFYIGVKLEKGLAWLEVEVLDYESMMVYSYYYVPSTVSNYIIAGKEM